MRRRLYIVDIEGTIVKDKSFVPVEGAVEWINSFKSSFHQFVLVSNNTTHKPQDLINELKNRGFDLQPENLITCLDTAVSWMKKKKLRSCFVIGTEQLREYLNENDIITPSDGEVEAVLVGLDPSLDYQKLKVAVKALIKDGALLLALHVNRIYHDEKGELSPSVGAVTKALEYSAQKKAKVFGKPNPEIYRKAMSQFGIRPQNCVMISDDPFSDLWGAKKLKVKTVFVTSGKYKDKKILANLNKRFLPDRICQSVKEIRI